MDFVKFKTLTRLEQSLFGLPIALTGALLPFFQKGFAATLTLSNYLLYLLVFPAFLAARISGMAFNQWLDSSIDALNPRTCKRPIPAKLVSNKQSKSIAFGFLALFLLLCYLINPLCFYCSLLVAPWLLLYSLMKRIHYSAHFVLGTVHAFAPIMAYSAITNSFSMASLFIGLGALFFIAGNDIIYALQDLLFDRAHKLHSIPSRFGKERSWKIAKGSHALALTFFSLAGIVATLPLLYFLAIPLMVLSFRDFYRRVEKEPASFFRCTVFVSASLFFSTLLALLVSR